MRKESYFRQLMPLSRAAKRETPEWMTPRALDLLDLIEASDRPKRMVRKIVEFTSPDIQAARTLLVERVKDDPGWAERRQVLMEVLTAAYTWKQVPAVIRALGRKTKEAAAEIQADTTVRYGWRGRRRYFFLILISRNDRMPIKARLQYLAELRPDDFPEAIQRFDQSVLKNSRRTFLSTSWARLHVDRVHARDILLTAQQMHAQNSSTSR